jgi:hypothetical protein
MIALGLLSHGEPRFIFFPLALIVVAGAIAINNWVSEETRRLAIPVAMGMAVLLVGSLALCSGVVRRSVDNRARINLPAESAAIEVRAQAGESTCGVLTTLTPQTTYYSECATSVFVAGLDPELAVAALDGEERFMILIENGRRQPEGGDLAGLLEVTAGPPVVIEGALAAAVYRFAE